MSGPSSVSRIVARVADLIALANSPNEHEARTAAWMAARLIRDHRLTVAPDQEPSAQPRPPSGQPGAPQGTTRAIRSRFAGRCRVCGERFSEGTTVFWVRGQGASHVACGWPT